jgi:hypothetical protein
VIYIPFGTPLRSSTHNMLITYKGEVVIGMITGSLGLVVGFLGSPSASCCCDDCSLYFYVVLFGESKLLVVKVGVGSTLPSFSKAHSPHHTLFPGRYLLLILQL